jgi:hypothetical protein
MNKLRRQTVGRDNKVIFHLERAEFDQVDPDVVMILIAIDKVTGQVEFFQML